VFTVFSENKTMDHHHLSKLISRTYEELVFAPLINQNPPPWSPEQVLLHLREHMVDNEFTAIADLREIQIIEKKVNKRLLDCTHDGEIDPNDVAIFVKLKSLKRVYLGQL